MTILRSSALALFLALPASAMAHHNACPWGGPLQVHAKMTFVTVNGLTYDIVGPQDRAYFSSILADCGATEAAIHFDRWRNARIATNATAVGGVVVDNRVFIGSLAGGIAAGIHKKDFRRALERHMPQEILVVIPPREPPPEPGNVYRGPRQPVPAPGY